MIESIFPWLREFVGLLQRDLSRGVAVYIVFAVAVYGATELARRFWRHLCAVRDLKNENVERQRHLDNLLADHEKRQLNMRINR